MQATAVNLKLFKDKKDLEQVPDFLQRIWRNLSRQGSISGLPVNCSALIGKNEAAGLKIGGECDLERVTLSP